MLFSFPLKFIHFTSSHRSVSRKSGSFSGLVLGTLVLAALLCIGCTGNGGSLNSEYHSEGGTPGAGGKTIGSDHYKSTVFIGLAAGGHKTESGSFMAYHGAGAALAHRMGGKDILK